MHSSINSKKEKFFEKNVYLIIFETEFYLRIQN